MNDRNQDGLLNEKNSWTIRPGNEAWLYSDAAHYFRAFANACSQAEETILIAGWDFHSSTVLTHRKRRGLPPKKVKLGRFLRKLVRQNPKLHIFILTWDFAPFFILERERLQSFNRGWRKHPRIHFHMDDAHPISASQHQKFVVVDSSIAFIGGLDLTIRRWDENAHSSESPLRVDSFGEAYGAFHDYQLGVTGPVAADFVTLFSERWHNATAEHLPKFGLEPHHRPNPLPTDTAVSFLNAQIAFSRTLPAFREQREVTEIAATYMALIQGAQHFILIENQYLTAHSIVNVLSERLKEEKGPEVVIILPEKAGGWLEIKTMGVLQDLALKRLRESDRHNRLRIYFPFDRARAVLKMPMTVHSKLIIIDDHYLSVGSANLNNRSMGYDTECQLTIDASCDVFNQKSIRDARAYVLAHHSEIVAAEMSRAIEGADSMIGPLTNLCQADRERHLQEFIIQDQGQLQLEDLNWLDVEKPTELEIAVDQWGFASEIASRKLGVSPRSLLLALTVIFAIALGIVWNHILKQPEGSEGPLKAVLIAPFKDPSQSLLIIPLLYGLGAIFFIPINLLIIFTASMFSTSWALFEVLIGIMVNIAVGYSLGRLAGRSIFERFFGKRTQSLLNHIGNGQVLTLIFIRVFPIAPSSLINLAAGSGKIPFLRFLSATVVGMCPGALMLVVFQKSLMNLFREPGPGSIVTLLILATTTYFIFRWSRRRFSQYRSIR